MQLLQFSVIKACVCVCVWGGGEGGQAQTNLHSGKKDLPPCYTNMQGFFLTESLQFSYVAVKQSVKSRILINLWEQFLLWKLGHIGKKIEHCQKVHNR